jgi:hypothetical protein
LATPWQIPQRVLGIAANITYLLRIAYTSWFFGRVCWLFSGPFGRGWWITSRDINKLNKLRGNFFCNTVALKKLNWKIKVHKETDSSSHGHALSIHAIYAHLNFMTVLLKIDLHVIFGLRFFQSKVPTGSPDSNPKLVSNITASFAIIFKFEAHSAYNQNTRNNFLSS